MSLELRYESPSFGARKAQPVRLSDATIMVGSLTSNQVAIPEPGVEPIHCMIERGEDGQWRVTDLGSLTGVKLNGVRIQVEAALKEGDVLTIGTATIVLQATKVTHVADATAKARVRAARPSRLGQLLFNPKHESARGRELEVVAYWGDTVLNVDHFAHGRKDFDAVTIGDPAKAHFISGGREFFDLRVLADVTSDGFRLRLDDSMRANVRKNGEMKKVRGEKKNVALGLRDYALVEHGPVRYFLHYAHQPQVELPKVGLKDAFQLGLWMVMALGYLTLVTLALVTDPKTQIVEETTMVDPWMPVQKPPVEPEHHQKPPVEIHMVTVEHLKKPVEPVKKPVKPADPVQQKPIKVVKSEPVKPVLKPDVVQKHLEPQQKPAPVVAATPSANPSPAPSPNPKPAPTAAAAKPTPSPVKTPSTNLNKLAANSPSLKMGGPGNHNLAAGQIKGNQHSNHVGVEGAKQNQPSLPNLSKLGVGLGKVSNLSKPGGLNVTFANSAGGAGRPAGSGAKTYNLGGPGQGKGLDIPGSSGKIGGWNTGDNQGLIGGNGGPNLANALGSRPGGSGPGMGGHSSVNVIVAPPTDPVSGEGLPPETVMMVIRRHLNEIRHCYEQVLQRQPKAGGRIKMHFVIGVEGRVTSANVADASFKDPVMQSCVRGKIMHWADFPRPNGGQPVSVNYPFVFSPQD